MPGSDQRGERPTNNIGLLGLAVRFVVAVERVATALESMVVSDRSAGRRSSPQSNIGTDVPVSDVDRASARAAARRLGLALRER